MHALLGLLLAAALPLPAASRPAAADVRGLWVVRTALVSPEAVDQVVDQAAAAGFNALFVQVRGRGDAFYRSKLVPRSVLLERQPASFDPLDRLLEAAHARGLAVHAWVNVLLAAGYAQRLPPDHVVERHPEWLMVPRSLAAAGRGAAGPALRALLEKAAGEGEAEGLYLSPFAPGVAAHLEDVVRELLSAYGVDGLHLDFIRYPGPEYDFSRWALAAYAAAGRPDPLRQPGDPALVGVRQNHLTRLAARLASAARTTRPGIPISAAVVPDQATAVSQRFQDWPTWAATGVLDAVCPMAYTTEDRLFQAQVSAARARLGRGAALWAGVVVFSHEWLATADLRRFREAAFPDPSAAARSAAR